MTNHGDLPVQRRVYNALIAEAEAAHPRECCGLLLGRAGRITQARSTANVHPQPETHFEIDPQALVDAHRAERGGGLQIMGYFHSHPTGNCHPSETDRSQSARDGKVWAIVAGDDVMFWQDDPGGFHALSYEVASR
ncbi:MAG: M67 family metallopeptidase [Pseudomonadota bacterium]